MFKVHDFDEAKDKRFTPDIHKKLKEAKVAIAGLGGLGSHIAISLCRSGLGGLHIIDFDKVDITNLNRQHYEIQDIGRYKTEALKEKILKINPYINISTSCLRVEDKNIEEVFKDDYIICEAFDKAENKAMLINGVMSRNSNKIVVSGSGVAGYGDANLIKTKRIARNLYLCGDSVSDVDDGIGLMAARVMVCAGHQANKVIEILLENEENSI